MKYKVGKLIEVFNSKVDKKVMLVKASKGYRVILFSKKGNHWQINKTRHTQQKKYAERRFIELVSELK